MTLHSLLYWCYALLALPLESLAIFSTWRTHWKHYQAIFEKMGTLNLNTVNLKSHYYQPWWIWIIYFCSFNAEHHHDFSHGFKDFSKLLDIEILKGWKDTMNGTPHYFSQLYIIIWIRQIYILQSFPIIILWLSRASRLLYLCRFGAKTLSCFTLYPLLYTLVYYIS